MSVYKVAQDVEADDKLIGPFSFRQFIYLIVVAISIALAWGLFQVFPLLVIIPMPVILFFGAIALPLRKDQPMEVYLAAVVSFHLKPKKRFWVPDGIQSLVEITAPKVVEEKRTKDIQEDEAERRFSYLASIMDTQGWAVRDSALLNPVGAMEGTAMISDVYNEAQQTQDLLDNDSGVAQSIDTMITQSDTKRRQDLMNRMKAAPAPQQQYQTPQPQYQPQPQQMPAPSPQPAYTPPQTAPEPSLTEPQLTFNPYPTSMHQSVISPPGSEPAPAPMAPIPAPAPVPETPQNSSKIEPAPDIINLANNSDLSIETIAHEAKRIHEKKLNEGDEVVISLH